MKINYVYFIGALLVSVASYVNGHRDLTTFDALFSNVQHIFGLLGVLGAVIGAFFARSPLNQPTPEPEPDKFGQSKAKLPLDVN